MVEMQAFEVRGTQIVVPDRRRERPRWVKDESHGVEVIMALDLIAAFVPSQVEREADELGHW